MCVFTEYGMTNFTSVNMNNMSIHINIGSIKKRRWGETFNLNKINSSVALKLIELSLEYATTYMKMH